MKKIKIAVLYGGRSAEHDVSILSTKNVLAVLNKSRYKATLFKIPKKGAWPSPLVFKKLSQVDVVFPILHGPYGEDGVIQGLCKLLNLPCVGADVLGSAINLDKDVMKRLLREAGILISKFLVFRRDEQKLFSFEKIKKQLGLPFFVKPVNAGSSIGISKVLTNEQFTSAIEDAFTFDQKIIIEEAVDGREIECSVLGNEKPQTSLPGEVITPQKFYSYDAKYNDEEGVELIAPAKLNKTQIKNIQALAIKVFKVLECRGMGRVDMFLTKNNKLVVNEINTIPGFTNISMYPKLWEVSGLSYEKLIEKLIKLAIKAHNP